MKGTPVIVCALLGALVTGCVAAGTHKQILADLKQARNRNELLEAQAALARTRSELDRAKETLAEEQEARHDLGEQLIKIHSENRQIEGLSGELRRERDQLKTRADDLERRLETAQQDLASAQEALTIDIRSPRRRLEEKALTEASDPNQALVKEKEELTASLSQARSQARDLQTKLEAEHAQVAALQEDKQRLMSGTTTAQEEIARLQKRAGELETEAAFAQDLARQLSERDQEIGRLRQPAADRETLAARLAALSGELEQSKQRVSSLTGELAMYSGEAARTRQEEHDELTAHLAAEEAEKARFERERAAKEAEIARLTQTHAALTKSLEAEIAKGDIQIQQVRDRLTINMMDRVLFDSGRAQVKPDGLQVLKRVSDILKNVTDKQIRIEGHTDNMPIGPEIIERFPTNWELSTARASSVVRYLIEKGGVNRASLSAVGYAENRPVASNGTLDGQAENRRIEIVLYPKDISEVANF